MFGAPPMFYDAAQAAHQEQRGIADYNAWVESFGQGGQPYTPAPAAGAADAYAQAGQVSGMTYNHHPQMQAMPVAMDQGHPQYQYQQQYVPETHDPYNQSYPQQTMNTTSDRPQRSLPRTSRRGYTGPAQPNMSSMPDGTSYPQPQQQYSFSTQDDYLFHTQPSQSPSQPQVQERPTVQTQTSTQSVPAAESIPQQRFQFAEYRHPDQLVAPAHVPSYTSGTPTSEANSFSSSPVSFAPDQGPSQSQGTSRKQGSGSKQAQKQAGGAQDKSKKRSRPQRESDSDDEDDDSGSFAIMSMPPSSAHGGPTRL